MFRKGKIINHNTYINKCLKPLVDIINLQRSKSCTKNMKFLNDNERPHVHSSVIRFLEREHHNVPSTVYFWLNDYILKILRY